jgi:hypothetical protein
MHCSYSVQIRYIYWDYPLLKGYDRMENKLHYAEQPLMKKTIK